MRKLNLILLALFMASPVYAAAPTRAFNYVAHTTIDPAQNNTNENALYSYLQAGVDTYSSGSITNDAISGSAAISASKLNLIGITQNITNTGSITNTGAFNNTGDVTITGSFSVSGSGNSISGGLGATPIGAILPSTGKFTTLEATTTFKSGTTHQGDILYDNGTSIIRLVPGTDGQFLKTQGASANPIWATASVSYVAGTNIESTAATERTSASSVYIKLKEFSAITRSGTINVSYDMQNLISNAKARLYVNGIAVGTENTNSTGSYVTYTDSGAYSVVVGDLVQLYALSIGGDTVKVKNFSILVTNPTTPIQASGL